MVDAGHAAVSRWDWPIGPRPAIVREFVVGPQPWSPGHRGVDLAGTVGQPVRAPAPGTVSFAGVVAGTPVVSIDHGAGLISSFEPVRVRVRRGQVLEGGSVLGELLGAGPGSHCLPQACLHWGMRRDGAYFDPLELVGAEPGPAVLLPLAGLPANPAPLSAVPIRPVLFSTSLIPKPSGSTGPFTATRGPGARLSSNDFRKALCTQWHRPLRERAHDRVPGSPRKG